MATMAVAAAAAQPSESITYEKRYKSAMDDDPSARTLSLFSVSLIQVKHIRDRFENELVDFCKCFGINNAVRYGLKLNVSVNSKRWANRTNLMFCSNFRFFKDIHARKLIRSEAGIK